MPMLVGERLSAILPNALFIFFFDDFFFFFVIPAFILACIKSLASELASQLEENLVETAWTGLTIDILDFKALMQDSFTFTTTS